MLRWEFWPSNLPAGESMVPNATSGDYIHAEVGNVAGQWLSPVWLFVTPWTAAHQVFLFFIIHQGFLRLMSIESVMSSKHLILCHPFLLEPSIFLSIRVFSKLALCIRKPKYWNFSFRISPSKEYSELISFRMDWFDLLAVEGTLRSLLQHHNSKTSFFIAQPSLLPNSHHHMWLLEKP